MNMVFIKDKVDALESIIMNFHESYYNEKLLVISLEQLN